MTPRELIAMLERYRRTVRLGLLRPSGVQYERTIAAYRSAIQDAR